MQLWDILDIGNADATVRGFLFLGDMLADRPGYLSRLGKLTKSRELRGHVQVTRLRMSNNLGQRELEGMLAHWPKLKVVELFAHICGFLHCT